MDVLFLEEEELCLELDDFDEVGLAVLLLEDLDEGAEVLWRAEEPLGLADPPAVKDDAPFCLALPPRLAEDMIIVDIGLRVFKSFELCVRWSMDTIKLELVSSKCRIKGDCRDTCRRYDFGSDNIYPEQRVTVHGTQE